MLRAPTHTTHRHPHVRAHTRTHTCTRAHTHKRTHARAHTKSIPHPAGQGGRPGRAAGATRKAGGARCPRLIGPERAGPLHSTPAFDHRLCLVVAHPRSSANTAPTECACARARVRVHVCVRERRGTDAGKRPRWGAEWWGGGPGSGSRRGGVRRAAAHAGVYTDVPSLRRRMVGRRESSSSAAIWADRSVAFSRSCSHHATPNQPRHTPTHPTLLYSTAAHPASPHLTPPLLDHSVFI